VNAVFRAAIHAAAIGVAVFRVVPQFRVPQSRGSQP
jgi:hypothetical protein